MVSLYVHFVGEVQLALIGIGVVKLHSLDLEYPFNFHMLLGFRFPNRGQRYD